MDYGAALEISQYLGKQRHLATKQAKVDSHQNRILFAQDTRGKPWSIPVIDRLLTILQVCFEADGNKTH